MEWRTVGLLIPHHTWPCNDSFSFYFFTATVVEHFPCTFLVFGAWWTNLETELPEWLLNMLTVLQGFTVGTWV